MVELIILGIIGAAAAAAAVKTTPVLKPLPVKNKKK
jgi:hypothetical protein